MSEEREDYGNDLLTLEDEEGKEHVFEVVSRLTRNDMDYVALVPYVETKEEAEAMLENPSGLLIMRAGEDEEGPYYDLIEDDEEYFAVEDGFRKILGGLFDFDDSGNPLS